MMTGSDWNTILDGIATDAAREVELPERLVKGFDGDVWTWIWTEYLEEDKAAEVVFQAAPDPFDNDIEAEVSAVARRINPRISWTARIWASYLNGATLSRTEDNPELFEFGDQLRANLSKAYQRAVSAAGNLEEQYVLKRKMDHDTLGSVAHLFLGDRPYRDFDEPV